MLVNKSTTGLLACFVFASKPDIFLLDDSFDDKGVDIMAE